MAQKTEFYTLKKAQIVNELILSDDYYYDIKQSKKK